MTKTFKSIEIEIFETPEGKPTCGRNFETGEVCQFLNQIRFGTEGLCLLVNEKIAFGMGYTEPSPKCHLHQP